MESASTSKALHLFPQEQRFKAKHGGCRPIDFSHVSSSHKNPNKSKTSTRTCMNRKEEEGKFDLVSTLKKRTKHWEEEEEALNKRQKRTTEHDSTTTKVCPRKGFESRITKRVDVNVVPKPEKTVAGLRLEEAKMNYKVTKSATLPRIRLHQDTKTKPKVTTKPIDEETVENQGGFSLRDLIAKAKNKVEEKRQIDGRREYIARKRLEARLAISRIVQTVAFDDHLEYHRELELLGCTFIHEEVACLTKFSSRSARTYF